MKIQLLIRVLVKVFVNMKIQDTFPECQLCLS